MKKSSTSLPLACAALLLSVWAPGAHATDAVSLDATLAQQVRELAREGTRRVGPAGRVEIDVGQLDPRLKLAPCEQVQPYLPAQARLWGSTRIGLRCLQGRTHWNVYLPITVKVYAPALVAAAALPAGSVIGAADLREAEVDWAGAPGVVYTRAEALVGRTLARPLVAGAGVRQGDLKPRVWFAAGDTVRITTLGDGFAVVGHGEALTPGVEGQAARVRTEGGRVVSAAPSGERQVELTL